MKYHPERRTTIVNNALEEKTLGKGWYDNPNQFPKPSRFAVALEQQVKPWWTRWGWIFGALTIIAGMIAAFVKLFH